MNYAENGRAICTEDCEKLSIASTDCLASIKDEAEGTTPNAACLTTTSTTTTTTNAASSDCFFCGNRIPKNRVTFITQILAIYLIIIVAAINLSLNLGSNQELWIVLLSSAVGYVLPNPGLKYYKSKHSQQSSRNENEGED